MTLDRRRFLATGGVAVAGTFFPNSLNAADANTEAAAFIKDHESRIRPLEVQVNLAWWNANISGQDEDFQKKEEAQNKLDEALADETAQEKIRVLHQLYRDGKITDRITARQIHLLFLQYQEKRGGPLLKKINAKANAVEQAFNVFRARVDGQEIPDSKVRSILKESTDSELRRKVWEASKEVGAKVEADLAELVRLRNQHAVNLGYKSYHQMSLTLNEQDGPELDELFDELDDLTREPYQRAKAEIDARLAKKYGIPVAELMPWHYHDPFFQEAPAIFEANLDAPYQKADIIQLCSNFYKGIGLPIDDVIARSDLYEKKGKSPHAFCTDIDREGDVRVLANIVPNEYWMATMLHELGHAVYTSKNIPATVPYVLRDAAHILTTEGVAMQFERFSKSRAWLEKMGVTVENGKAFDEAAARSQRHQLLIFSRWCQVMWRFERGLYSGQWEGGDPRKTANEAWWDLVEKYQLLKRPPGRNAPDYASKIHICSAPVYYHNYLMGQLFASQVHHALAKEVYNADPKTALYIGEKKVGEFMRKKVFEPGRTLTWRELTQHATGEKLNARAFAKDFEA